MGSQDTDVKYFSKESKSLSLNPGDSSQSLGPVLRAPDVFGDRRR